MEKTLQEFKEQVAKADLAHDIRAAEGNPLQLIARKATANDLVALGRNSLFNVDGELYDLPLCVERIIREEPSHILLVPTGTSKSEAAKSILVAFDGSAAASRALHMFALLGLVQDRAVYVVTIAEQVGCREGNGRTCVRSSGAAY